MRVSGFGFRASGAWTCNRILLEQKGQVFHVFYRSFREDAVAKIEDVAGVPAGESKNMFGARLQLFPIRKEQNGIQIALYRAAVLEIAPGLVEWDPPVEADDLGSGLTHRGKQCRGVGAKINYRGSGLLQTLDQVRQVGQDVAAIVFDAEAADPTVENLDDVGAGVHLGGGVLGGDIHQLAH